MVKTPKGDVSSNLTNHFSFLREKYKDSYENIKMFGGFFMNIKLVGTIISVVGAAVSLADQFVKSKNLEELVKKEVEKQLNKR